MFHSASMMCLQKMIETLPTLQNLLLTTLHVNGMLFTIH